MNFNAKTNPGKPIQIESEASIVQIFNNQTGLPTEGVIQRLAVAYADGFNDKPWDIYGWHILPKKAEPEVRKLILTALNTGGALVIFQSHGLSTGFNIISDMGVIFKRLEVIERFKIVPKKFINPRLYLESLVRASGVPISDFGKIAYLADIVVDVEKRAHGYGKLLLKASVEHSKYNSKKYALAWSINPIAIKLLKQEGFERIKGLGDNGEGIDFLFCGKAWYPTLVIPSNNLIKLNNHPIIAEHYIKAL